MMCGNRRKCVSSVPVTTLTAHQPLRSGKEGLSLAHRSNVGVHDSVEVNVELRGLRCIAYVLIHLSRIFAQAFQLLCPELSYIIFVLRAILDHYHDEYMLQDRDTLSFTSFSSVGERIVQLEFASGFHTGMIHYSSSQECLPTGRSKLIVGEQSDHDNEQWGHFADFESVEDDHAGVLSSWADSGFQWRLSQRKMLLQL